MSAAISLHDEITPPARTTTLFRLVEFVCPRCGDERQGIHLDGDDGVTHVQCAECRHQHSAAVLAVPTRSRLEEWRADALHRGHAALLSADADEGCPFLTTAAFRRLADDLTGPGKLRLLDDVARSVGHDLGPAQRRVFAELGAALALPAGAINAALSLL